MPRTLKVVITITLGTIIILSILTTAAAIYGEFDLWIVKCNMICKPSYTTAKLGVPITHIDYIVSYNTDVIDIFTLNTTITVYYRGKLDVTYGIPLDIRGCVAGENTTSDPQTPGWSEVTPGWSEVTTRCYYDEGKLYYEKPTYPGYAVILAPVFLISICFVCMAWDIIVTSNRSTPS